MIDTKEVLNKRITISCLAFFLKEEKRGKREREDLLGAQAGIAKMRVRRR